MSHARPSALLRWALILDAVASGAMGLLLLAAAGVLAAYLGLPGALLQAAGAILLPWTVLVAFLATRDRLRPPLLWTVVALNALWVAASLLLLVSGWVAPTALGLVFVLAQAAAVAVLTEAQFVGLRRAVATA